MAAKRNCKSHCTRGQFGGLILDCDTLRKNLEDTRKAIETQLSIAEIQFEKLTIATTTSLKLLNEQQKVLEGISGNPDSIKSYLIRLTESVRREVIEGLRIAETQLADVLKKLEHEKKNA